MVAIFDLYSFELDLSAAFCSLSVAILSRDAFMLSSILLRSSLRLRIFASIFGLFSLYAFSTSASLVFFSSRLFEVLSSIDLSPPCARVCLAICSKFLPLTESKPCRPLIALPDTPSKPDKLLCTSEIVAASCDASPVNLTVKSPKLPLIISPQF